MKTSSSRALVLLLGAVACAALAAFLPAGSAAAVAWGVPWAVIGGGLLLVLVPGLWRRRRALASARTAGSWGMHAGLVVVVAAGGWYALGERSGGLEVIEGQTVPVADTGVSIRLVKLHPVFLDHGWPKGDAAEVDVIERNGTVRRTLVYVNRPLRIGSTWLSLGVHGYAPLLLVTPEGAGRGGAGGTFVSLETVFSPVVRYWRRLAPLPGLREAATLVFRPSPSGPYPRDPRLTVILDGAGGRPVSLTLAPGRPVAAAGHRFELREIRRWGGFTIRREPGLRLLFAGLWIAIAGAAWSMLGELRHVRS